MAETFAVFAPGPCDHAAPGPCDHAAACFPSKRQAMAHARFLAWEAGAVSPKGRYWFLDNPPEPARVWVYRHNEPGTLGPRYLGRRQGMHIADVWANITRRNAF